jgi:pyoverdine/dityrosine biosynthesis protein Dit1
MSMLNFQTMSRKELHNYVLTHREDQDAFYAYVDKLHNEGNWVEMPAVDSVEDLEQYPEFVAKSQRNSESRENNHE